MNIGFIEDTHLRGGTQIWVTEATKNFIFKGENVVLIAPKDSYVALECKKLGAKVFEYDWEEISINSNKYKKLWTEALSQMDVAITTVHPPRNGFHCSVFAGECLRDSNNLNTVLIPKTGTIVPEYKREFYLPSSEINVEIICIAEFTRKYLVENYNIPSYKTHLIYQGVEIDRFKSTKESKEKSLKKYILPDKAFPILGCVGSLEERKGQIVLLQAIEKILADNKMPNIHLIIVGEGPDEKKLKKKVVDMGLENNVTFFPFTKEPNYVFDRIDALVLPSLCKEGLPNVLQEAMSMGVPVISSAISGISEIVISGKTGYLVEPNDCKQLANSISKLFADEKKYLEIKENAKKLIRNNFNKKTQFDKFLKFLKSVKS